MSNKANNNNAVNGGNTRRHTVGPGDVAHEQALVDPNHVMPLSFKCEQKQNNREQTNILHPPINLPMLENQPLQNLTTKDQHLLKPPLEMGASKLLLPLIPLVLSISWEI